MDQDSAHMVAASKVPMLKPGEFELWRMRIKQYIQMIDYAIWEVIENGATLLKTAVVEGVEKVTPITSTEDKAQRSLEVKGRSSLMIGIPNEHQLKFNSIKDAKLLLEAAFKSLADGQLEVLEKSFTRRVNQKVLRSLSPEVYNTHAIVWRSNADPQLAHEDLQQIHPDDIEEIDLRWQMAMLTMRARRFLKNTGRKITVNGNKTIGFDKSKVECYNCHKRRHFAKECRAPRNQDNKNEESSRRSVPVETSTSTHMVSCDGLDGYDWSDQAEEGPSYALMAYSSSSSDSENESVYVENINGLKWDIQVSELRKKLEKIQKEKDSIQFNVDKFENASKSLNKLIECQIIDNCKKGLGYEKYNAVPPPYTGNFMPPTSDLSFTGLDEFVNKPVVENCKAMSSEEEPKVVRKNDEAPIIEEWVSDNEEEDVSQPKIEKKTVRPTIVKKEFF
ncbi:ribonuclease H-like domain-containing protein [Tanacetum coccineum]